MKKGLMFGFFLVFAGWMIGCSMTTFSTESTNDTVSATSTMTVSSSTTNHPTTFSSSVPSTVSTNSVTTTSSTTSVTFTMTIITKTTQQTTTLRPITTVTREQGGTVCLEETFPFDETIYDRVTNVIGDYTLIQDWATVGETICLNIAAQFADADIVYDRYVLQSNDPSVATVHHNLVTIVGEGTVSIGIAFYNRNEHLATFSQAALLRGVNPATWHEIRTAEELAAMNQDKSGVYVLKADIDLTEFGEWTPIGGPPSGNQFSGVFLNPEGHVISNLRISTSASVEEGPYGGLYAGLFGSLANAVVDGVILENVYIDVTDYASVGVSIAGGVAASVLASLIRNCYVSGYVKAQYFVGGIVGSNSWGLLEHNYFWGEVHAVSTKASTNETGVGGIVGFSHTRFPSGGIVDCHVHAIVLGFSHAGGIVGSYVGEWFLDNSFEGSVSGGASTGALIGFDRYTHLPS